METNQARRKLLQGSAGILGMLASGSVFAKTIATACGLTPAQTSGPFYPIHSQPDTDNDLTQVNGSTRTALGEVVHIYGMVQDEACKPVPGAWVEIWQACASGRYNHPSDTNPAPIDPDFQYWGKCVTDANGEYHFTTVKPGAYPASETWMRPPHIHFKVHKLGFMELTTQMYFAGEPLNDQDDILKQVPSTSRSSVIVEFGVESGGEIGRGRFDMTIRRP